MSMPNQEAASPDEVDDRRGSGRVSLMSEVILEYEGRRTAVTALDLSVGGMAVWCSDPIPKGPMQIHFDLGDGPPARLVGKVVRTFESDGGSVWGLAFQDPDPSVIDRLRAQFPGL